MILKAQEEQMSNLPWDSRDASCTALQAWAVSLLLQWHDGQDELLVSHVSHADIDVVEDSLE